MTDVKLALAPMPAWLGSTAKNKYPTITKIGDFFRGFGRFLTSIGKLIRPLTMFNPTFWGPLRRLSFANLSRIGDLFTGIKGFFTGIQAKSKVIQTMIQTARTIGTWVGKIGRVLGKIHINMLEGDESLSLICLNDQLIKEKHAVAYFGGKR